MAIPSGSDHNSAGQRSGQIRPTTGQELFPLPPPPPPRPHPSPSVSASGEPAGLGQYGPPPVNSIQQLPPLPSTVDLSSRMTAAGVTSLVLAGLAVVTVLVPIVGFALGAAARAEGVSAVTRQDTMGWLAIATGALVLTVQAALVIDL